MTPTSDERREVAARLREYATGFDFGDSNPWWYVQKAVFGDVIAHDTSDAFALLADLIDPTCSVVRRQAYTGGPQMYKTLWCCSECGYPLAESKYKGHRPFVGENFCPGCGARVTDGRS